MRKILSSQDIYVIHESKPQFWSRVRFGGTAASTVLYRPLMKDECKSLAGWLSAGKTFVFGKKSNPMPFRPQ